MCDLSEDQDVPALEIFVTAASGCPRRVLVENQSHRRQHPQRRVGDYFVDVADER
jgi:hypothetical protein